MLFISWNVTPLEAKTKAVSITPTVNNRGKAKPNKTSQAQVQELLMSTFHTEPIAGGLTTAEPEALKRVPWRNHKSVFYHMFTRNSQHLLQARERSN